MFGPRPRFRPYSTPGTYGQFLGDLLLGQTARGDDVAAFEEAVKAKTDSPYALIMPQARIGIFMAIRALISPGQKVILSPYTIYDVVNMVICAGGVPVFADIERETCNVDPWRVMELIDGDTGAVLVTHLHGCAMDLDELAVFCRERGVPLIEDAAQAFGARLDGRHVGTIGDAGIYSFGLYKNINALYGGMVVTRRRDLYDKLAAEAAALPEQRLWPLVQRAAYALQTELLTWPPVFRSFTFHIFRYAYLRDIESFNRRVREENDPKKKETLPEGSLRRPRAVQARLALGRLDRVDDNAQIRLEFARMYHEGLNDLDGLILPPFREDGSHIYIQYPVQCPDRKSLVRHMMREGCDVACQHMRNCADIDCFAEHHRDCPNARLTAAETVVLPTYPKYGRADVERNIRAIRSYFAAGTAVAPAPRHPAETVPEVQGSSQ